VSQIKTFEAMLSRGQDSDMLRYTLGNAYYQESDYEKAIEHFYKPQSRLSPAARMQLIKTAISKLKKK